MTTWCCANCAAKGFPNPPGCSPTPPRSPTWSWATPTTPGLRKELPGHVANRLQAALYREMLHLIDQDVLSVEEADAALSYGPGLRWGVMGQSLQWHLGGGAGGIKHFMEQLMDPLAAMMKTLGNPEVTPELKQTITDGVMREAAGRSVDELAQKENEVIIGLLKLRANGATAP